MEWFRQIDLAEMRRELSTEKSIHLLSKITVAAADSPPASDWDDWLDKWRACPSNEKDRLLRPVFAVYRENPEFEWWHVWFLMFIDELVGLFSYFRSRIPDPDERWSVIAWSFLKVLTLSKANTGSEPSVIDIRDHMKRVINRTIQTKKKNRRLEVPLPEPDLLPGRSVDFQASLEEEQSIGQLRDDVTSFLGDLPVVDRIIIEETYFLGRSRECCAARLGLSRHQVDRRLLHIKDELSRFLNLPIIKRRTKF